MEYWIGLDAIHKLTKGQTMKQPFKPQLNPIVGKGGTAVPRIGGSKVKTTATGSG